ncbi:MAG TPA: hypothetical protein PLK82_11225, partial [Bacteroidales bacterium]|nr:hypothetical protein [Bacteroidales bacterium]
MTDPAFLNRYLRWPILTVFLLGLFISCGQPARSPAATGGQFTVKGFDPMLNWDEGQTLFLDYPGAITSGFIIPGRQADGGYFDMEFLLKNTASAAQNFRYKIYYQNESYKFPERDPSDTTRQHPLAWENFYGSWEEAGITFAETGNIEPDGEFHKVHSHFRIVGNPRNEQRYFDKGVNDRWKRNPRVGTYRFMLVVTEAGNITQNRIPAPVQDIGLTGPAGFVNPFYWFLYGPGRTLENTVVQVSPALLKVVAKPDPGAGIFLNPVNFSREDADRFKKAGCGQDSGIFRNAAFEQFIHFIDPSTKMNNIPVIADVLNDNYSRMDYNWNKRFWRKEELVAITATVADPPCETVISDPVKHTITIRNPHAEFGKWKKQNVGVITRHGMTFGRYTVKCKLTELLNRNNMWNGLTNAIWLITQSQADWNFRRDCNKNGYMANYYGGLQDQRVKNVGYSEIDFEILKT